MAASSAGRPTPASSSSSTRPSPRASTAPSRPASRPSASASRRRSSAPPRSSRRRTAGRQGERGEMSEGARLRHLADRAPCDGRYVLYWMQRAQRARDNHALEFAIAEANRRDLPVVVGFGLMDDYPEANERHYAFMLEGLREVAADLAARGI